MRKLLPTVVAASLTSLLIPFALCNDTVESKTDFKWNKAFGQAVLDWVAKPDTNSISIEVDWNEASWGLGAEILLKKPINLKDVANIEVSASTSYGSPTKIYVVVSTPDDANLSFPSKLAYSVTSDQSEFNFPVDKFVKFKPDTTSKDFKEEDWKRVDRIKFILTKPATYSQGSESITISNPRIIYRKKIDNETSKVADRKKSELNKALKQLETTDESDNRYITQTYGKFETSDAQKKLEITHYQSINELMEQYPYVKNLNEDTTPKLIFEKVSIYEDSVQDWKAMDGENKFFFDISWKNGESGFAINFLTSNPIETSGEWHLVFTAQTLDHSEPKLSISAYSDNEYNSSICSHSGITLKNKWKTFYVPLNQKKTKGRSDAEATNSEINRIHITCLKTNASSIREDVIVIKDLKLVKKQQSHRIKRFF